MMGSLLLALMSAQNPPIRTEVNAPASQPSSRPLFEVDCTLRELDSERTSRVTLSQYGGVYVRRPSESFGGREPTYVRFSRDDLGIFGAEEIDMTGHEITDWYSDGKFELTSRNGGFTFYKTAPPRASWQSPTKVAVTVRGGKFVRDETSNGSVVEFLMAGSCDVSWQNQQSVLTEEPNRKVGQ